MNEERQAILDKIRKLISKRDSAEKIGSIAEAQTYAAKISELLIKYNIELAQLEDQQEDLINREFLSRVELERRHEGSWVPTLAGVLARYNFCLLYINGHFDGYRNLSGTLALIGEDHNREIVKYLLSYLVETGRELGRIALKNNPDSKRNSFLRAFYDGFVSAIYKRLRDEREASESANTPMANQYALVLRSAEEKNHLYLEKRGITLRQGGRKRGYSDSNAKVQGFMAGENVALNKGLKGGKNNLNQNLLG